MVQKYGLEAEIWKKSCFELFQNFSSAQNVRRPKSWKWHIFFNFSSVFFKKFTICQSTSQLTSTTVIIFMYKTYFLNISILWERFLPLEVLLILMCIAKWCWNFSNKPSEFEIGSISQLLLTKLQCRK